MCAAYLQTCHFSVKIAVLNEKNVIHVNRVDPESFYLGGGGVQIPIDGSFKNLLRLSSQ